MAKVRGISIELSADTSGIVKGLKDANSSIRNTQKELRDINRLLKLDPTNMTLLKQRTQALRTEIGQTSDKLKQLKELEKQMKAEGVDENSDQFRALQREIIATEQELKKLQGTAGSGSAKMLQISEAANKVGDSLDKAGKKLLPVTAGITAMGAASIKAFEEVDQGYDEMIKKTGATGEAAEELRGIMNNLATTIPTDFETAGKAVGEVSTRFGITGDELETLSAQFVKFAALNNTDVSNSIDKVQKALSAYGLSSEDASAYLDMLNKTAQDTGVSVDKLAEGMVSNGAAFQEMGLSIDQATVFMGQLEKSGANSETVLNGMRKALKKATKEGKPLNQALEELQDTILNGTGSIDGLTAAYDLFGKSGDQIYAAVKGGTVDFKNLGKAAASAAGNIDSTFEETLDPVDKFKMSLNQLKVAGAEMGSTILTMLAPAIQKLSDFIKNLSAKWKGLDDGTKKTIVSIGGVAAAIGPVLIILGKVAKAISAVTKVMSTMKFAALVTNPVTLAIAALAGLAAGFIAIKKAARNAYDATSPYAEQLDDLQKRTSGLADSISETEQKFKDGAEGAETEAAAAETLTKKLFDLVEIEGKTAGQKEQIKRLVEQLNEIVPGLGLAYDEEKDALNRTNEAIKDNIALRKLQAEADVYSEFYTESLKERVQAEMDMNEATEAYQSALENCEPALKDYLDRVERGTISAGEAEVAGYRWGAQIAELTDLKKQANIATENYNKAVQNEKKAEEGASASAEKLANEQARMADTLNSMDLSDFRAELENTLGKDVADRMNDAINAAEKAGVEIPDELKDGILSGEVSVKKAIQTINKSVQEKLASNKATVKQEGVKTDLSYASGLEEKKASVKQSAGNVANSANDGLKTGESKAGTTGDTTGANYAAGIQGRSGDAQAAGTTNAGSAVGGLDTGIAPAGTSGTNLGGSYATGISNASADVSTSAGGLVTSARNNMVGDASDLGETFGKSYGDGIASVGWYVGQKVVEIVGRAKQALQEAQDSGSPSKVAMSLGNDFGEGYAIGISDNIKNAAKAAQSLVNAPNLAQMGYNRAGSSGAFGGRTSAITNNYTQNNYSPRTLSASDIYRQTHNLINAKGVTV